MSSEFEDLVTAEYNTREKVAAELYGAIGGAKSRWPNVAEAVQAHYREVADLVLDAALPDLRRRIAKEIAAGIEALRYDDPYSNGAADDAAALARKIGEKPE